MQVQLQPDQNFFILTDPFTEKNILSLNYANPGPAFVDFKSLSVELQEIIEEASRAQIIEITEFDIEEESSPIDLPPSEAQQFLAQSVKEVVAAIQGLINQDRLDVIEQMLILEREGQNNSRVPRKMVITALNTALQQHVNIEQTYNNAIEEDEFEEVVITYDTPEET